MTRYIAAPRHTLKIMIKTIITAAAFATAVPLLTSSTPLAAAAERTTVAEFQLSTHVLDISAGTPGVGVDVVLEKKSPNGKWTEVGNGTTGKDGRIATFLEKVGTTSHAGTYRFTFGLEKYFKAKGVTPVFPEAVVVFKITDATHYHIPVVVTPYAISTYRGS